MNDLKFECALYIYHLYYAKMCRKCNKQFCICCGETSTKKIIESYVSKLSTIMLIKGTRMTEQEFNSIQQLQHDMVLWSGDAPVPHIDQVIKKATLIIWKNTSIFGRCEE
jgi:hypothetical protein